MKRTFQLGYTQRILAALGSALQNWKAWFDLKCHSLKLEVTDRVTWIDCCAPVVTRNRAQLFPTMLVLLGTLSSLALKMETAYFPETLVSVYKCKRRHNPNSIIIIFTSVITPNFHCVMIIKKLFLWTTNTKPCLRNSSPLCINGLLVLLKWIMS
jgi:hypothetical protein